MLLITDLDNTLLRGDKSVSDYTAEVFRRCRERGILTAFATARAERAMARFIEALRPDCIISNGGAMASVRGEVICQNLMSAEDVRCILTMSRAFTGGRGRITAQALSGYYCNFTPDDPDRRGTAAYSDFSDFAEPAFKVTAELERREWAEEITEACPACTVMHYTGEDWRCFSARNADKGTALCRLASHLGVAPSEITAFGDDLNDLSMMKFAGTAVAVGNAVNEVKDAADFITDTNEEDGVARYIEERILSVVRE